MIEKIMRTGQTVVTAAGRSAMLLVLLLGFPALSWALTLPPLVSAEQLHQHLDAPGLVILDVRSGIDNGDETEFPEGHVPGAVHSDYLEDGWRVTRREVPGMLPPIEDLEQLIGGLGIGNDSWVVIVPAGTGPTDFGSATRVYWTFLTLGHERVSILNGGFAGWRAQGLPVERGRNPLPATTFKARYTPEFLATADSVERLLAGEGKRVLVDARPREFFTGESKAWVTRRAGTIPGAVNGEHFRLVRQEAGVYMEKGNALKRQLAQWGLTDPATPVTSFCTSGHWATINWFALHALAGYEDVRVYDGSMAEWTRERERPIANGRQGMGRLLDYF